MKLSLLRLLKEAENEEEIQQASAPVQTPPMGDPNQEMPQATSPEVPPQVAQSDQSKSALSDIVGSTVSDISYERVGTNGGKLTIKTSSSHVPLTISWAGPKVTVSKQNGTVAILSGDG